MLRYNITFILIMSSFNLLTCYCKEHQIKLTPLRQQVLEILFNEDSPLTAYHLLSLLQQDNKIQAMSVYRVLEFFQQHNIIHRIESLNAYKLCCHLDKPHVSQWLICDECGSAEECTVPNKIKRELIQSHDFKTKSTAIELHGVCKLCQKQ